MVCTFFGHRDCAELDKAYVYKAVEDAIQEGADVFLVGHQGRFDRMVYACLRQLRKNYPQIEVNVVLSRLPENGDESIDKADTVFPEAVDNGLPRFAIDRRNRWMLRRADMVICYVKHSWGGAYKYVSLAVKQGKTVRNIASKLL